MFNITRIIICLFITIYLLVILLYINVRWFIAVLIDNARTFGGGTGMEGPASPSSSSGSADMSSPNPSSSSSCSSSRSPRSPRPRPVSASSPGASCCCTRRSRCSRRAMSRNRRCIAAICRMIANIPVNSMSYMFNTHFISVQLIFYSLGQAWIQGEPGGRSITLSNWVIRVNLGYIFRISERYYRCASSLPSHCPRAWVGHRSLALLFLLYF